MSSSAPAGSPAGKVRKPVVRALHRASVTAVLALSLATPMANAENHWTRAPSDTTATIAFYAKLGLKEARVQLWRNIQRSMATRYDDPAWGDSFYCVRLERWRVWCNFRYRTARGAWFGYGRVEKSAVSQRGDEGAAVRAIQRRLGLKADGEFGAFTERAVRRFQRRVGLKPDGVAGPDTRAALGLWVGYRLFWRAR